MKKLLIITLLLASGIQVIAQQNTPKEAFLEKWENSKNYLIEMATLMPEDGFDFKPTERQRSFQEQLWHIKGNMDWLSTTYFMEDAIEREKEDMPATKAEIIEQLSTAFDNTKKIIAAASEEDLSTKVKFFAGPKSKFQILNLLQDHVTHHRGQLIVYLNLKNVEPPRYVGW